MDAARIRASGGAGIYYPADKIGQERELSLLLEASSVVNLPRPVRAILVPHDTWMHSGGVAARAYRQLMHARYRYVVVLATAHHSTFPFISIYDGDAYQCSFGNIPVDRGMARIIAALHPDIRVSDNGHESNEPAIEVHLPFLKWTLGNFSLIPIVFGEDDPRKRDILWKILIRVLPMSQTLFVGSVNLSRNHTDSEARILDQTAVSDLEVFDAGRLAEDVVNGRTEMCGFLPAYTVLKASRAGGAGESRVILYRNSGDITGNRDRVTGYLSAVFY